MSYIKREKHIFEQYFIIVVVVIVCVSVASLFNFQTMNINTKTCNKHMISSDEYVNESAEKPPNTKHAHTNQTFTENKMRNINERT